MTASPRLRIAILNRYFSPNAGGAERYSVALVEQLAQSHEIHVFAQQISHQWPGVTYHTVSSPMTKPRWLNQLWYATATWWATRVGFDVVHSHENTWHGQVQTIHVLPVKYTLFNGRSGLRLALRWLKVLTSPRLQAYLWLEYFRFSGNKKCIVVTSKTLMTQVEKTYPAVSGRLNVVTPGISRAVGFAAPLERLAARQRLNLPASGQGVLFVGNDYEKKGLTTLVKALAMLPDTTWLAVVGNASQAPEFRAQAKVANVQNKIFFLGKLDQMSDAYVASDCLAHPTLEDTFGMAVLEAMAHGLPVVVTSERYCGISGLLTHGTNALILPEPRDANALSIALLRLIQEADLSETLQKGSVAFAGLHQWAHAGVQQEKIYASVL